MTQEEKLPKEAEWGEEDEIYLSQAIETLEHENYLILAEKLKSLRLQPKQKWSDEDERMRNQLIYDVEQHKEKCLISAKQNKATKAICDGIEKCQDEKIAWLKSIRPSWKPSEEQMRALKNSAYGSYQNGDGPLLRELYDDLLKLK